MAIQYWYEFLNNRWTLFKMASGVTTEVASSNTFEAIKAAKRLFDVAV